MLSNVEKTKCKQFKITSKKYMGDDEYSWAVFVKGSPVMTGLGRREVDYTKEGSLNVKNGGQNETKSTSGRRIKPRTNC